MDRRSPVPGDGLIHPASLAAIVALILNDHWWKAAFPGAVTGKISDFAGLAFFPSLLVGLWEIARSALGRPWGPSRRAVLSAALATAVAFSLVKLWAPAAAAYRVGWAALGWPFVAVARVAMGRGLPALRPVMLVRDPTDLMALPAIAIAIWVGLGRVRSAAAR